MKSKNSLSQIILSVLLCLTPSALRAEPWLGTRFAQNCAGCHAPGRINQKTMERRCTLSCQGCHVNPNGGGIRNFYGEWNTQRWLRSFHVPILFTSKPAPATFRQQMYAKTIETAKAKAKAAVGRKPAEDEKAEPHKIYPLVTAAAEPVDEAGYSRADGQEKIIAESREQFLDYIPRNDPYREERSTIVSGGGDIRYLSTQPIKQSGPQDARFSDLFRSWLMAVDFGARVRPVQEHAQLVLETRFLTPPMNRNWDQAFTTEARIRSAYVISDDLPFNSYAMYGLYRPMFGLYNPDHDSLSNVISGLGQRNVYKSFGVGAAPNVPFVNLNFLTPLNSKNYDQSKGVNLNFGGRWVTMGASLVFSYQATTSPDSAGNDLKRHLAALTGGLMWERFLWNWEILYITREFAPGASDSGSVVTNQFKYRLWRETYAEMNVGIANTAMNLKEGASNEVALGLRSFMVAGTDMELLYQFRNNRTPAANQSLHQVMLMAHLFF